MTLGNIARGIGSTIKSGVQNVSRDALFLANRAENTLGSLYNRITSPGPLNPAYPSTAPLSTGLANVLGNFGLGPQESSRPQIPSLRPTRGVVPSLLAPQVSGSALRSTVQSLATTPAMAPGQPSQTPQTPSVASAAVSPAVLNAAAPSIDRASRAAVPLPPPAPTGSTGIVPTPSIRPAAAVPPVAVGAPTGSPFAMSTMARASGLGPNPSASFGAAVPTSALIRSLAATPDRGGPPGFVETPEVMNVGARPRRKDRSTGPF